MSESINLMILDRFRHVERMMRVAAPPCEHTADSPRSGDTERSSRQPSQNDKICTIQGVLKRDAVLPFLLCMKRGMKQKEIADEIRVSPSTLSEMINRLVEDGYVERKADDDDRRAKTLFLTEAGKKRAEYMLDQITLVVDSLFVNLDNDEKCQLIRLLDKLVGNDSNDSNASDKGDDL